jgi:DNA polymerase-3 subunit delta'
VSFGDIAFQDRAVEFLTRSLKSGKLSQSLLFFGPEAVGKRFASLALAKALNCVHKGPADCCDECASCRRIEAFNHPDVHWIGPSGAANRIPIEAIKSLKDAINLKPFEGKTKVFVVDEAHHLTGEAANSMLKVLEEPPADSVLVLIADDIGKILPTLRSRCQWVHFRAATPGELEKFLIDRYGLDGEKSRFLSCFSEGRIGKAIAMKDKDILSWKNEVIDRFTFDNVIFHEDPLFLDKDREKALAVIDVLAGWYRDILVLVNGLDASSILNADRRGELVSKARSLTTGRVEAMLEGVLRSRADIERNVNAKLVIADLACELSQR